MLTIIHGSDITNSRKYFLEQRDNDSLFFDAQILEVLELTQSMQSTSLFENNKKIFIDNLFSKKSTKNYEEIIKFVNSSSNECDIYIYSDKDVSAKTLATFSNFKQQNFKIPLSIFSFLDSLRPNNSNNVVSFHNALLSTDAEIIFAMIVRQFRLLLAFSSNSTMTIDEVKRLAPWQQVKFKNQAKIFGINNLKFIYNTLYNIDKEHKTGKTNLNLIQAIDIFLIDL